MSACSPHCQAPLGWPSPEFGTTFLLQSARPLDASAEAKRTAVIVNELSDEIRKILRVGIFRAHFWAQLPSENIAHYRVS